MASKSNRPFLIYLLGAKDAGKSMYAGSLAEVARSGVHIEYRGQTWTLALEEPLDGWTGVDGRQYHTKPVMPQADNPATTSTAASPGPGLYCFMLTRKTGNEKMNQPFILLDPPGGFPIPSTEKDHENSHTKSLSTIWSDCNKYSIKKFNQKLIARVDTLLFINGEVFPKRNLLKKERPYVIDKLLRYLCEPFKSHAPEDGLMPFVAHFILYHTASEFLVQPMVNETLQSILSKLNRDQTERANNYKNRVDQDYQDFVATFMDDYKLRLREHTGYRVDTDPFFGSPVGQTVDGQRNWSFRTGTFIDRECWRPLFVLEPIIELVRLSWGEPR